MNKKPQKQVKNIKKIVIVSVLSMTIFIFCAFYTLFFAMGHYFFAFALDASFAFRSLTPENYEVEMDTPEKRTKWFESQNPTMVEIETTDGYKLCAYQINAPIKSNNTAIIVHGYRSSPKDMSYYAFHYQLQGFNVLLPFLMGHGQSEGRYISMGSEDAKGLALWIDKILKDNPDSNIVLHGVSMGATSVMIATGETLPQNVKCAIADCGFSSAYDQFKYVANSVLNLPFPNLALKSANFFSKRKTGKNLKDINAVRALEKSVTPTLFIHGSADDFVPFYMQDILFVAHKNENKAKLVIEGAGHAYSATKDPEAYFDAVFNYIHLCGM